MSLNYYDRLIQGVDRIAKTVQTFEILKDIYDKGYFEKVKQQIIEMKKQETTGPVNSMFVLMTDDDVEQFKKLKRLEKYLHLVFNHPTTSRANKEYIKKELAGCQSLNMLFEVSIIGNVLNQLKSDRVRLYANTRKKKNVDLEIRLVNRPVYIEISVLGESKYDKNILETMTKNKIYFWSGSRDLERDTIRFSCKISDKLKQFLLAKPNVLILSKFDFFPVRFNVEKVMRNTCFRNVGLILQFDRKNLQIIHEENLDPACALNEEEKESLIDIFKGKKYSPVYY